MSASCVPTNRCGTLVPGWMAGTHPGVVEGVVERSACFSMGQLCCMVSVSMRVKNCSGFYVYKLDTMPPFNLSFRLCGDGVKGQVWFALQVFFTSLLVFCLNIKYSELKIPRQD